MRWKWLMALMAVVAIGITALPSDSFARHGWRGHGGFGHGWYGGYRGYYGSGYYPYYSYAAAYSCWRNVRVATPYGWGWRRVWVCG